MCIQDILVDTEPASKWESSSNYVYDLYPFLCLCKSIRADQCARF